jgi:hypothetical protein
MGNTLSSNEVGDAGRNLGRAPGVTAATQRRHAPRTLPPGGAPASPSDFPFITECLARLLIFNHLDSAQQHAIVQAMYERPVAAGEILIQEGDTGLAASELYVVKTGEFEVLQRRKGVNLRVNMKRRGDTFGEVSSKRQKILRICMLCHDELSVLMLGRPKNRVSLLVFLIHHDSMPKNILQS